MTFSLGLGLWLLAVGLGQTSQAFETAFNKGLEALGRGDLESAEASFQEAQELQPGHSFIPFYLGEIYAQRQQFGEAIVHLRKSIDLGPREPRFYLRLAALYSHLLRFLDARRTLQELLKVRPDFPTGYLMLARVAREEGNHALAEQNLRRYLELNPEDPEALSLLGASLLALERLQEAHTFLSRAVERNSQPGFAHYQLGLLYSRQGKHQESRQHLQTAVELLPENAQAHYQLGSILARLEDSEGAEKALRKAIELASDLAEAYYALGTLLRRLGRSEEAAHLLAEHTRLSSAGVEDRQRSRRVSSLHLEVKALLEQNRLAEAEQRLNRILEIDSQNDFALYRLAQIFYLRNEYQRSLETIGLALDWRKVEPAYFVLEGMCLERLGRDGEAAAAYRQAIGLGDHPDAFLRLSQLELRQGKVDQAIERLRQGVAVRPQDPRLRQALEAALQESGQGAKPQKQDRQ